MKYYFIWPDTLSVWDISAIKDLTFFAGKLAAPTTCTSAGQPQAVVGSKSAVHEWHRLPVFGVEIGHLQNGAIGEGSRMPLTKQKWSNPKDPQGPSNGGVKEPV